MKNRFSAVASLLTVLGLTFTSLGAASAAISAKDPDPPASSAKPQPTKAAPTMRVQSKRDATQQIQHVTVNWTGTQKRPKYTKTAVIPGIGNMTLNCRPNFTKIELYVPSWQLETQVWIQKYEYKNGRRVVAVKVPRIFRYAHAYDAGKRAPVYLTGEGLNQQPGIENRSSGGYMNGVISQRPGRNASGSSIATRPVTTFELNWFWNGFDHPQKYRSCKIDAVFQTYFEPRMGVNWHGEQDPAPTTQDTTYPGVGTFTMSCPHDGAIAPTLTFKPANTNAWIDAYTVFAEGQVEAHDLGTTYGYDEETGLVGPIPIPQNGTLRLKASAGGIVRWLLLSSYWIQNNSDPALNLCETAAAAYTPARF